MTTCVRRGRCPPAQASRFDLHLFEPPRAPRTQREKLRCELDFRWPTGTFHDWLHQAGSWRSLRPWRFALSMSEFKRLDSSHSQIFIVLRRYLRFRRMRESASSRFLSGTCLVSSLLLLLWAVVLTPSQGLFTG